MKMRQRNALDQQVAEGEGQRSLASEKELAEEGEEPEGEEAEEGKNEFYK